MIGADFRVNDPDRCSSTCISGSAAGLVLFESAVQRSCDAGIKGRVSTFKDIEDPTTGTGTQLISCGLLQGKTKIYDIIIHFQQSTVRRLMNILDIFDLHKSIGSKKILNGISLTVGETEKVGLIGRNGSGKTTLLHLVAGLEPSEDGRISYQRGARVGYLPQEPVLSEDGSVAQEIESTLSEIRQKVERYHVIGVTMAKAPPNEMPKLLKEQEVLGSWISHHGGWETDHRIDEALAKLGVVDRNARISMLSGGMKKRVALAKLLIQAPDLLLLDEPTNHLDTGTTQWLEEFLIAYPGAVMLITHDRYFLDRVAQRIFELETGSLYSYPGGYSDYLVGKAERLVQEQGVQGRLITLLRRESAWMARGPKARGTKQKARIKRFHEMQGQRKDIGDREIGLHLETQQRFGHIVLECTYLCKSFGEACLIDNLSFDLKPGDRIGIIGPNGSGKTTFLRMIMKEEHLTSGKIIRGKNTKIAYFDQQREALDPDQRVEDVLGEGYWVTVGGERRHKSGYLSDFLFEHTDQKRLIRTLSGGEKARLMLARLMLEEANLLILDEPTNDLDIPTLQLLDDSLRGYNGSVLMVTHDRFFLDKVATGILSFEGEGKVRYTLGNFEDYQARTKNEAEAKRFELREQESPIKKSRAQSSNKRRGLSFNEQRELSRIEEEIEGLEAKKKDLEGLLSDPGEHGYEEIQKAGEELVSVEKTLSERVDRWEVLEAKRMEA